jgi:hypothetical protein
MHMKLARTILLNLKYGVPSVAMEFEIINRTFHFSQQIWIWTDALIIWQYLHLESNSNFIIVFKLISLL